MTNKLPNTNSVPVLAERIDNLIKTVDVNHQSMKVLIEKIENNTVGQISGLQNDKADRTELDDMKKAAELVQSDHEDRIRSIESKVWKAVGALIVGEAIILPVVLYLFFKTLN